MYFLNFFSLGNHWSGLSNMTFYFLILHIQPLIHRHGSVERGQAWDEIASILNSLVEEPFFKVTPRSARDRYSLLVKKYKSKWRAEEKASGISPNHTEIDEALHDLTERFNKADAARQKATAKKNPKLNRSLCLAQNM